VITKDTSDGWVADPEAPFAALVITVVGLVPSKGVKAMSSRVVDELQLANQGWPAPKAAPAQARTRIG
jgi:hypothetical protein